MGPSPDPPATPSPSRCGFAVHSFTFPAMLYAPNGLMPNGYASTGAGPAPPKLARRLVPAPGPTDTQGIMTPSERAVKPLRAAFSHWNAVGSDLPTNAQ